MIELFKNIFNFLNTDILQVIDVNIKFSVWDIAVFCVCFMTAVNIIAYFVHRNR